MEVATSVQRRRRWTPEQKVEIVKQTNELGSSVSLVARQHGLTAAQLFQWRKAYLEGSLVDLTVLTKPRAETCLASQIIQIMGFINFHSVT